MNNTENKGELTAIDAIIKHQKVIATVQQEAENLQKAINDKDEIILLASNTQDLTAELILQREELLAATALGNDKTKELKAINEQLANAEKKQALINGENQLLITESQQTKNGLQRLLNKVHKKLAELQRETPKLLDVLLMEKAINAHKKYNDSAKCLIQTLYEIVSIDILISKLGQRNNTNLLYNHWELKIPSVDIEKQHEKLTGNFIVNTNWGNSKEMAKPVLEQLKQDLVSQSIIIDCVMG